MANLCSVSFAATSSSSSPLMSAMNGIAFRPSTTLPHPLLPCFTVSVSGLSFFFAARRADRFIALPLVDKEIELKICEPAENKLLSQGSSVSSRRAYL